MDTVNLYDAKANLSNLVERAARGEEIVIAKAGRPLTRRTTPRPLGLFASEVTVGEHFDDPLPDDIRLPFEGGAR
jgi:antitoxin (DNA-binding transcriptional repressor) of toxin-antitoxin stability system